MEANYVHKDSTTLIQDKLVKNELNQIELQYNALKQQKFNELLKENQELKQKYLNAVADYETTMTEKNELKKQLEEYREELEKADSITQSCIFNGKKESEISYRKCLNMLEKHKNQQKEFIEYLESEIKQINQKESDIGELNLRLNDIKFTQYLIYKEILQKYKSIIGVSDENRRL